MKSKKSGKHSRAGSSGRMLTAPTTNHDSGSLASESHNERRGRTKTKSQDLENQAVQWLRDTSIQRIEAPEQMINRLEAQKAKREGQKKRLSDQIEDFFACFVNLDNLDDAQREDAIEMKDDIIKGIELISYEADSVQVDEFERNKRLLRAVGQAREAHDSDGSSGKVASKVTEMLGRRDDKKKLVQDRKSPGDDSDQEAGDRKRSQRRKSGREFGRESRLPPARKPVKVEEDEGSSDSGGGGQANDAAPYLMESDGENKGIGGYHTRRSMEVESGPGEAVAEQAANTSPRAAAWGVLSSNQPVRKDSDVSNHSEDAWSQQGDLVQDKDTITQDIYEEMVGPSGEETEPLDGETLEKLPKEDSPESGIQSWLQGQPTPIPKGLNVVDDRPTPHQYDYDAGGDESAQFRDASKMPASPARPVGFSLHPKAMAPPPPPRSFNEKALNSQKKPIAKNLASLSGHEWSTSGLGSGLGKNFSPNLQGGHAQESAEARWKRKQTPQPAPEWKGRMSRSGSLKVRSRGASMKERQPSLIPEENEPGEENKVQEGRGGEAIADKMELGDEQEGMDGMKNKLENIPQVLDELSSLSSPDSELLRRQKPKTQESSPIIIDPSPGIAQPWSSIMIEKVVTPELPMKRLIRQALTLPGQFTEAMVDLAKAQVLAWVHLFWFVVTCIGRYANKLGHFFFDPVQLICAHRGIQLEWPFAEIMIAAAPPDSQATLATHVCGLILLFFMNVYVAVARERAIWMQANGLTRVYMLEHMHEDPSWRWLPGVDPKLMFGLRRVFS